MAQSLTISRLDIITACTRCSSLIIPDRSRNGGLWWSGVTLWVTPKYLAYGSCICLVIAGQSFMGDLQRPTGNIVPCSLFLWWFFCIVQVSISNILLDNWLVVTLLLFCTYLYIYASVQFSPHNKLSWSTTVLSFLAILYVYYIYIYITALVLDDTMSIY